MKMQQSTKAPIYLYLDRFVRTFEAVAKFILYCRTTAGVLSRQVGRLYLSVLVSSPLERGGSIALLLLRLL